MQKAKEPLVATVYDLQSELIISNLKEVGL